MRKRMVYAVLVAVALAVAYGVSTYAESPDVIMGCVSLWPFC